MSQLNRVRQSITSPTGTGGPLVLASSAYSNAYQTISGAGGVDQTEYCYIIEEGTDWEIQRGIWTLSSNELARNTPFQSSIGGVAGTTKLTLAGAAFIRVIADAKEFASFRGVRAVTGSSDTISDSHSMKLTVYNRSSAIAVSLAAPSGNNFKAGWVGFYKNINTGVATITATGATIYSDGVSSTVVSLNQYESLLLFSDGTNYYAIVIRQPLWIASLGLTSTQQLNAANNILVPTGAGAQSLTAAQKAQVRANADILRKNYIVNGAMMVSQENGTTAGTTSGYYPVDQFSVGFSNAGAISTAQVASVTPAGSPNRLRVTVTTADASVAAGDWAGITTNLEGLRVADLLSGTASAKSIIIKFGVKAPAGTYCVALRNNGNARSYVGEYTISGGEANTDVQKTVTLTLDTTGTWLTTNGIGISLFFTLMAGTTFHTTAGAWAAGNFYGTTNQFNFMGTNSNVFELFDVGLYEGSAAPSFLVPDYASELQLCLRYWQKTSYRVDQYMTASNNWVQQWQHLAPMRASPTRTVSGSSLTNASSASTTTPADEKVTAIFVTKDATTGIFSASFTLTLSARM